MHLAQLARDMKDSLYVSKVPCDIAMKFCSDFGVDLETEKAPVNLIIEKGAVYSTSDLPIGENLTDFIRSKKYLDPSLRLLQSPTVDRYVKRQRHLHHFYISQQGKKDKDSGSLEAFLGNMTPKCAVKAHA